MSQLETVILANGCFWCTEAIFNRLKGVTSVVPGYAASQVANPSYKEVYTGRTGAAEATQITYDPSIISYDTLLEIFWHTHDPTTLNRQGNDIGTQYRSAIFYQNDAQKQGALASKEALEKSGTYKSRSLLKLRRSLTFIQQRTITKIIMITTVLRDIVCL